VFSFEPLEPAREIGKVRSGTHKDGLRVYQALTFSGSTDRNDVGSAIHSGGLRQKFVACAVNG
jgi:hypothetical protein